MTSALLITTFRIAGVVAVVYLIALAAQPFEGVVGYLLWVVSGSSLVICLGCAWKLRDGNKGATISMRYGCVASRQKITGLASPAERSRVPEMTLATSSFNQTDRLYAAHGASRRRVSHVDGIS